LRALAPQAEQQAHHGKSCAAKRKGERRSQRIIQSPLSTLSSHGNRPSK
jgi:hypothetical protein